MSSPEPAVDPPADPHERAARLGGALRAAGIPVHVEVDGAVAILVPRSGDASVRWASVRADVVRLAQAHGFRSVAVDLARPDGG